MATEQAIIVTFNYGIKSLTPLHNLERELERIIEEKGVGDYDGHEIAVDYSDGFLYMYGPNVEELFEAVKSTLVSTEFLKGAEVKLRFGPPEDGVKEIKHKI